MECRYYFFFFKQKTAYEMRISDWSSDVCSSDLEAGAVIVILARAVAGGRIIVEGRGRADLGAVGDARARGRRDGPADRQRPRRPRRDAADGPHAGGAVIAAETRRAREVDRKSTRLNSSH